MAAVLLLAPTSSAQAGTAQLLDRVVAVVNDDVVLLSELEREFNGHPLWIEAMKETGGTATPQQIEQKRQEVRAQVLDDLIERQLIKREAARFQISVSDADVNRYIKHMISEQGFASIDELRKAIESSGESWPDWLQATRDQILVYITTSSLTNFKVTEAQVREKYRKLARDVDAQIELEQLSFVADVQNSEARDRVYAAAQTAARRLRSGEGFGAVASELGQQETRRTLGRGEVAPQLEDAIFAAKTGQVVGPLPSGQGYVVYKIVNREDADVLSFEQARDRLRAQLEGEAFLKADREFREQLRAKAHIDIRL